jgi:hypothetical protein
MYAFLRGRRFSDAASAAGAAAWAFSTGLTAGGSGCRAPCRDVPPAAHGGRPRLRRGARGARGPLRGDRALLCLAGGFPHWILFGAIAAALYLAVRCAAGAWRRAPRAAVRLAAGVAIAAAVLFPRSSPRRGSCAPPTTPPCAAAWAAVSRSPAAPALYALPDYYGTPRRDDYRGVGWIPGDNYIEVSAGVGVAAAGLAFVGLASVRRRREAAFAALLGAAVAVPLYAGGALLERVGGLPLLDIGLFARAKILVVFAAGILAACGVESLERLAAAWDVRRAAVESLPFLVAGAARVSRARLLPGVPARGGGVRGDAPGIRALRERTAAAAASPRRAGPSCRTSRRRWNSRTSAATS